MKFISYLWGMKVPAEILAAASEEIAEYGEHFRLMGELNGKQVYAFKFPNDVLLGFPFLYLYKDHKVDFITGREALMILRSLRAK